MTCQIRSLVTALLIVIPAIVPIRVAAEEYRKWADVTGKFTTEAKLLGANDGTVQLEKKSGSIVTVAIPKLSVSDREYLRLRAEPTKNDAWRTDMDVFMRSLFTCVQQQPDIPTQLVNNTLVTKFDIVRDGRPIYRIYEGHVGEWRTTQGYINELLDDGKFSWQATVGQIKDSQQQPGKVVVMVPIPKSQPPQGWGVDTTAIGFYLTKEDAAARGIRVGSKIQFSGTLKKDPNDKVLTRVTAFHGIGDKAGESFLKIGIDAQNATVERVTND